MLRGMEDSETKKWSAEGSAPSNIEEVERHATPDGGNEGPIHAGFGGKAARDRSFLGLIKDYRAEFVLTQNGKILLVAIVLFGAITAAQFAAAFIANSLALLADCGAMLADVITYVFNFLAECRPKRSHVRGKLVASLLSLLVLVAIACWAIHDAVVALANAAELGDAAGSGNVNPNMVLAFGIVGIIFDIVALIAYFMPDRIWRRTKIDEKNELVGLSGDELSEDSASDAPLENGRDSPGPSQDHPMTSPSQSLALAAAHAKRTRINMLSALLHIGADAMRSTTTIASAAIMIGNPAWDSNKIDSIAALVVSSLVLVTGLAGFIMWCGEFRKFWRHRRAPR